VFRSGGGFGVLGAQVGSDVVIDVNRKAIHFGCCPFAEVSAAITFITSMRRHSQVKTPWRLFFVFCYSSRGNPALFSVSQLLLWCHLGGG
jgi:hypothetical protein